MQGPLKKWTEHSQELHLLKIHSRGLLLHPGAGWGLIFWTMSSYQDLSNEGSKIFTGTCFLSCSNMGIF